MAATHKNLQLHESKRRKILQHCDEWCVLGEFVKVCGHKTTLGASSRKALYSLVKEGLLSVKETPSFFSKRKWYKISEKGKTYLEQH